MWCQDRLEKINERALRLAHSDYSSPLMQTYLQNQKKLLSLCKHDLQGRGNCSSCLQFFFVITRGQIQTIFTGFRAKYLNSAKSKSDLSLWT